MVQVHLKEVHPALGPLVEHRRIPFAEAVGRRLFRPLGRGSARIGDVLRALPWIAESQRFMQARV